MKKFLILSVLFVGCNTKNSTEYLELVAKCQDTNNLVAEYEVRHKKLLSITDSKALKIENLKQEQETLKSHIEDLNDRLRGRDESLNILQVESEKQQALIKADAEAIEVYKELVEKYENTPAITIVEGYNDKLKAAGRIIFQDTLNKADGHKWVWNHTLPFLPREKLNSAQERVLKKAFREDFAVINEQVIRPAYADAIKTGYSVTYKLGNSVEVFYIELE